MSGTLANCQRRISDPSAVTDGRGNGVEFARQQEHWVRRELLVIDGRVEPHHDPRVQGHRAAEGRRVLARCRFVRFLAANDGSPYAYLAKGPFDAASSRPLSRRFTMPPMRRTSTPSCDGHRHRRFDHRPAADADHGDCFVDPDRWWCPSVPESSHRCDGACAAIALSGGSPGRRQ
jgi:hypothetical protein